MTNIPLSNSKRLLLGLTGSVAAYKTAELSRLLIQDGLNVQIVMTESACHFIGPVTLQALTGKPVFVELWDARIKNNMAHIDLVRNTDAILIAPASANFISKIAHGLADDLLSTLCLTRDCPLLVVPAMNRQMWENPATQRNLATLKNDGVIILGPAYGDQACGETGVGRMLEAQELARAIQSFFQPKPLENRRVLITAGPTYEAIDAVRGITNLSSGKMGYAMACAAVEAGAQVTLISGPVSLETLSVVKLIKTVSARDMLAAVKDEIKNTDIFISIAAVADYRSAEINKQKIKRATDNIVLEFIPNFDILGYVTDLPAPPFCVGFSAETENLEENARTKRHKKKLPLIVANLAQDAIGSNDSELLLLDDMGTHFLSKATKIEQARRLIKHIVPLYNSHYLKLLNHEN
ncbi:MAG: bifunctional phosphopantothenoylcysteine decarboxylase/phosphopantothenate--cysteine ligase CoaBC [Nitrosospira sp.]|nr:bifunctional phosphopantothenoylcysteine decarboxylase/phosphopantothenate--cysteine ligase CoaBC [Nitrosospira sp.]MDW7642258.1 bifunctional phosphopantothenoylcysteine decarboxylase/phosphopantothenate--cysteine ligase CoaBC [Nitrosomonadaceae bacterium]MBI0408068.1 bifunctional phosphopantothenoylcysteine decarboxylase/phosphopantothenate--cysteine ligase CoaBC [Nitrosospira sp.]MBI0414041.1 bifunctional phosphopantothenoylcysteine decarboxylase/phosphopantothenate--cysteine ligase CoaBC [